MKKKLPELVVTPSRIRAWRKCQKAHEYSYVRGLRRKSPPIALLRGTILHKLIDAWKTGGDPYAELERLAKTHRRAISENPEYYGNIIGETRDIFNRYVEKYRDDGLEVVESEYRVDVDLTPSIRFRGTIDKVVRNGADILWIQDHKSHANIPDESSRFHDLQLVFYVWAWNSHHPHQPVSGVIWDYIRTKSPAVPELLKSGELSRRKNIDTTYEVYYETIVRNNLDPDNYQEILAMLRDQQDTWFRRVTLPSPPDRMLYNVVDDAINSAVEIRRHLKEKIPAVRTMSKDCSFCQFQPLCSAEFRGLDSEYVESYHYTHREDEDYASHQDE